MPSEAAKYSFHDSSRLSGESNRLRYDRRERRESAPRSVKLWRKRKRTDEKNTKPVSLSAGLNNALEPQHSSSAHLKLSASIGWDSDWETRLLVLIQRKLWVARLDTFAFTIWKHRSIRKVADLPASLEASVEEETQEDQIRDPLRIAAIDSGDSGESTPAGPVPYASSEGELSFTASYASDSDACLGGNEADIDLLEVQDKLVDEVVKVYLSAVQSAVHNREDVQYYKTNCTTQYGSQVSSDPPLISSGDDHDPTDLVRASNAHGKRPRCRDDDDDHDNDGGRRKDARKRQQDTDLNVGHPKLFACPFSKFDPSRYSERNMVEKSYRGCSSCFLRDISRVKQHLYRVHKRPDHYCGSCFEDFDTQKALDAHSRRRPVCELAEARFPEKMSRDQLNSIKRRRPGKNSSESWFNIFKILFPDAPLPESPFCEAASPTLVHNFSEQFLAYAPGMLSELVRIRVGNSINLPVHQQQILDNALEESLSEMVQHFATDFTGLEAVTAVDPHAGFRQEQDLINSEWVEETFPLRFDNPPNSHPPTADTLFDSENEPLYNYPDLEVDPNAGHLSLDPGWRIAIGQDTLAERHIM